MLPKGNQRSGGGALADHLTNTKENDHVELYELRGFIAEDLHGALQEVEMVAKGTKCQKPFFSVSFNPSEDAEITLEQYERAFDAVDEKFGLQNQPRAILFHDKLGRRHAHAAYSRIDVTEMKAIELGLYKLKLREVSRDLHREFGIEMPAGLKDPKFRNPNNFDLTIWQQAKRIKEDPRDLKQIVRTAYDHSDSKEAFQQALELQGLFLARGDRRGFVALHHSGEVLSISKYGGIKPKDLKRRIGKEENLRTLDQARDDLKEKMTAVLEKHVETVRNKHKKEQVPYRQQLLQLRQHQRQERFNLAQVQGQRWRSEELTRAKRLRKGIGGLWDRLSGKRGKISQQNQREEAAAKTRDKQEKQTLINQQIQRRQELQNQHQPMRERHRLENQKLRFELGFYLGMDNQKRAETTIEHARDIHQKNSPFANDNRKDRGPDFDPF